MVLTRHQVSKDAVVPRLASDTAANRSFVDRVISEGILTAFTDPAIGKLSAAFTEPLSAAAGKLAAGFPDPAIGKLSAAFTDLTKRYGNDGHGHVLGADDPG